MPPSTMSLSGLAYKNNPFLKLMRENETEIRWYYSLRYLKEQLGYTILTYDPTIRELERCLEK